MYDSIFFCIMSLCQLESTLPAAECHCQKINSFQKLAEVCTSILKIKL